MIDTSLTSSNFYFLIAVVQGLILAFIIVFKRPVRKSNIFFGLLILFCSLSLLHLILEESIHAFNSKFPVPMEFSLSYGPLAYLHILYIKDPLRKFRAKDLLHFLPSFLLDGVFFTSIFLWIGNNMEWAQQNIPLIQTVALFIALFGAIQLACYAYLIYRESKEAKRVLRDFEKIKTWLNYLISFWSVLIVFLFIAVPIALSVIEQVDENSEFLYKPLGSIIALFIYVTGYLYVLKYSKLVETYSDRISKFSFSTDELSDKKDEILKVLSEEKIYQDPGLTIAKMARQLNWPINNVSRIINESLHTNFNDLINHHRIIAFKERIVQPESEKYSIVGLGQEVGFSSKASFYRAFKKETGMTPSEFMKNQV
ncbi:MAG: helix-turn-helix domain-containing protein [bacterium]|nr:helix-turn-helix domain-containing protein [bacterium]